jgi:hypothetical protein
MAGKEFGKGMKTAGIAWPTRESATPMIGFPLISRAGSGRLEGIPPGGDRTWK